MDERGIGGILPGLLIAGGLIGLRFYNRADTGSEVREAAHSIIMTMDGYSQNQEYVDFIFNVAHKEAFDDAYRMGGRRRRSTFDEDLYFDTLFATMINQSSRDGSTHIAEALQKVRDRGLD